MTHTSDPDRSPELRWPEGIDTHRFLRDYWQRRPLWMPGALRGLVDPLTPEELAGLALEGGVESRLVTEAGGAATHGPFVEDDFRKLADEGWTVLVQRVDQLVPGVARLLEPFRFIPNWRLDDVMVSYAAPGGGVGAHVDSYDVFLVQGRGRRRWTLPGLGDGESRELLPGDALYVPPGCAHEGVATESCMTYSVGFRAPTVGELVADFLAAGVEAAGEARIADPGRQPAAAPGEISAADLERVVAALAGGLEPTAIGEWFGRFVTRPAVAPEGDPAPPDVAALREALAAGRVLRRSSPAHFAFVRVPGGNVLFAGGEGRRCPGELAFAADLLSGSVPLVAAVLDGPLKNPRFAALVAELIGRGLLYLDDPA